MNKICLIIAVLVLWASPLLAQQASEGSKGEISAFGAPIEGRIGLGWYGIEQSGNPLAGEYRHLKSSPAGILDIEWDPLPHRFVLESYFLNPKDYFGEIDYSYRDVVLMNMYSRGMFHNLHHYGFGQDDPGGLQFTDLNATDRYGIDNHLRRAFLRLKTPDFPLHLFADARSISREGTIQQRFFRTPDTKVSQSREIDWDTMEYRAGVNSHLGPVELEYYHAEKKFEARGEKGLFDPTAGAPIPHNLVPDLNSSSDTVKAHSSYSGRIVISGTYTDGDKENEDSLAKATFTNMAGDIMLMPVTSLIVSMRYRHYELEVANPDTAAHVTSTGIIQTVNVRDSISTKRDVISGVLRYRATDRLTLKGEYMTDTTDRTRGVWDTYLPDGSPDFWTLPKSTTKNTAKAGLIYRVMKKATFRADYASMKVDNPAYAIDPDKADNARVSITWTPALWFNTMVSYGMVREERDGLNGLLGGGRREVSRDNALVSATVLVGSRSSVTASYALYKNNVEQTVTVTDGSAVFFELAPEVPYDDVAHVGSLALTIAPADWVNLVGSVSRSHSRGTFSPVDAGAVDMSGIAELSDLKVIDTVYAAGIEMELTRSVNSEVRYEHRKYDDRLDESQDGTMNSMLATLSLKW